MSGKKIKKPEMTRNIAFALALVILCTTIASYMITGSSIQAADHIVDASSAAESYLAKNTDYVQQNRLDRAKARLRDAVAGFRESYETHKNAMSIAIANQKYDEALEECDACLTLIGQSHADYEDILTKKGCLEALLGKYSEAVETLKKVADIDDNKAEVHLLLAELYLEQGDITVATEELVKYSDLNPEDSTQLPVICELYYGKGNYLKAIEYGERALASGAAPDMDLYNAVGLSRLLTGDFAAARQDIDKAIECGEKDLAEGQTARTYAIAQLGETYYFRGLCELSLEQYDEAITDYDRAIELGYQTSLAYYNRGVCKLQVEDYEGCYEDMKVVAQKGDEPEITEIAETLIQAIDTAKADAQAEAAARTEEAAQAQAEAMTLHDGWQ